MKISNISAVLLLLATVSALPQRYIRRGTVSYDGHQVYRISTNGDADTVFDSLSALRYERWDHGIGNYLDMWIPSEEINAFRALELDYTIIHENLGAEIAKETGNIRKLSKRTAGLALDESWFDSYHAYDDHIAFWAELHRTFSNNSEPFLAGQSHEGRDMFGVKFFDNSTGTSQKPALVWHGTVHAREWITTMTLEYIAYHIIKGYQANDTTYISILKDYDIYILPIVNPDGFIYSQTKDRLWRKNRVPTPIPGRKKDICYGTDINRNWPYQWSSNASSAAYSTSSDPCSPSYRGSHPSSSPETTALASHLLKLASYQAIAQYIDFHSYGTYILSPYGYTQSQLPTNSKEQIQLAEKAAKRMKEIKGEEYTVGTLAEKMYTATGLGMDFAKDVAGARFAYTLELGAGEKGGFILPPSEIRSIGEEVLEGVKVLIEGMRIE